MYGSRFYVFVFGLLAIIGWGGYAYYVQLTTGLGVTGMRNETSWAFYIINFVFLIGISHAGTLISAILRVANAEWRRPITRMAESITVMAILVAFLFPVIDLGRPERLTNVFTLGRIQSPLVWDFLCIGTYLIGSTVYLYLPLIPDIAECRDRVSEASRFRRWFYQKLSLGWTGKEDQERRLKRAIKIMAVLIIPIAVSVHTIVSWDFAMTLRVEWHSTIFAPYFVGGAIFSGIATIIIMMAVFRRLFHLDQYLQHKHFVYLALMMLALNMIMIYLTISKDLVAGYGSEALDLTYLTMLFTGPYWPYFWFQIFGGLVLPAVLVAVPRTRRSLKWLVVAAILVDVGMWVERFLLVVPALATPQLPYGVGEYFPSWVEISIVGAGFAGFVLLLGLFGRVFPVISLWEVSEGESASADLEQSVPSLGASGIIRSERSGAGRRKLLKLAVLGGVGLIAGSAIPGLVRKTVSGQKGMGNPGVASSSSALPLSNLGMVVGLEEAKKKSSFRLTTPESLPSGAALKEVRMTEHGDRVALLYESSELEALSMYHDRVAIAIFQTPDKVMSGAPEYLPREFVRFPVAGTEGFARKPERTDSGALEPGQIQWWNNGIHYSIFSNMPVQELRRIASSRWT